MSAVDEAFVGIVERNPRLRPRVGNPDEMRSNKLVRTLEAPALPRHGPEPGLPEDVEGAVITALNEEAVIGAALGNKGGINLVHTYEAFGPKMLGMLRQEIVWSDGLLEAGRGVGWLSLPLLLTSHTWENAKNEQSHQDPALCEALLGELSHLARVLFPADASCAAAAMEQVYRTHGQIWAMVTPKRDVPDLFELDEARATARQRAELAWAGSGARRRTACSWRSARTSSRSCCARAARRAAGRASRDLRARARAAAHAALRARGRARRAAGVVEALFPESAPYRVFVTHTRPEPMLGVLSPLHTGVRSAWLGYVSRGGTFTVPGLLFANRSSHAHVLAALAQDRGSDAGKWLEADELEVLAGRRSPMGVIVPRSDGGAAS
jgi:phosphoketolase